MLFLGPKGLRKTPCGDEVTFSPRKEQHFLKPHSELVPPFLQLFSSAFITSPRRKFTVQKVSVFDRDEEFTFKIGTARA